MPTLHPRVLTLLVGRFFGGQVTGAARRLFPIIMLSLRAIS